jgi:hypothetical protein
MWRATIGVLCCLGLAICMYPPQRSARDLKSDRIAELRSEVAGLERALADERSRHERAIAALEARLHSAAQRRCSPPVTALPAASVATVQPSAAPDVAAHLHGDAHDPTVAFDPAEFLMEAFSAQRDDPTWARRAEAMLQSTLGTRLTPPSTIESVECRAQLCRITTHHPSQDALSGFWLNAFKDPNERVLGGQAFTYVEDGDANDDLVAVSYVAREGHDLPSQPQPDPSE